MNKADIGFALDNLEEDVKENTLGLVSQYRIEPEPYKTALIKQAVDTAQRARAQLQAWIDTYDAKHSAGAAAIFLASCLIAANSTKTLSSINQAISTIENAMQTLVNNVTFSGWTWEQVATAIEANISTSNTNEDFTYLRLQVPSNYITVWGEPY